MHRIVLVSRYCVMSVNKIVCKKSQLRINILCIGNYVSMCIMLIRDFVNNLLAIEYYQLSYTI